MRLMRGIIGPDKRLGVIDTEGKRASYYYDTIPGGFDVIDFDAPYSPERYIDALDVAEKNFDGVILDSGSHSWEGPDGMLDLHEQVLDRMCKEKKDDWKERKRLSWTAWNEPKQRFNKFRSRLLQFKVPLIICFRGKNKSHMVKGDRGNEVIIDEHTTPIFESGFIFEMHVAIEVFQKDGRGGYTAYPMPYAKTSHPGLRAALPPAETEQLAIKHGEAVARWCAGTDQTLKSGVSTPKSGIKALKKELWELTEPVHKGNPAALNQFLIDEAIISDTETLETLVESRYPEVIEQAKSKINNPQT